MEGSIDAEQASVSEREVEVGAHGLGFDAETPFVRLVEPDGYIGVEEGEGELFVSLLEVDPGVGALDVGEAKGGAGARLGRGRDFSLRGLDEYGVEVPMALGVADEVEAGLVEADAADLEASSPQG